MGKNIAEFSMDNRKAYLSEEDTWYGKTYFVYSNLTTVGKLKRLQCLNLEQALDIYERIVNRVRWEWYSILPPAEA